MNEVNENPDHSEDENFFSDKFTPEISSDGIEKRIDRIEEKAQYQLAVKQSTSFFFNTVSVFLKNTLASICGGVPPDEDKNNRYKP